MNDKKTENTVHGLRILAVIMLIVCAVTVSLCYLVSSRTNVAVLGEEKVPAPVSPAPVASASPVATKIPRTVSTPSSTANNDNIAIPGWKEMTVEADSIIISVPFYNPDKNENFLLAFSILVPNHATGDYEMIYESQPISAGERIDVAELTDAFSPGIYEKCIVHIQPYSVSDNQKMNNVDEEVTIISQ